MPRGVRALGPRPAVSGLALLGPQLAGERAKAPLKLFEINYGAQTRIARPGVRGVLGGTPKTPIFRGLVVD